MDESKLIHKCLPRILFKFDQKCTFFKYTFVGRLFAHKHFIPAVSVKE